jgi:hypothetical protein
MDDTEGSHLRATMPAHPSRLPYGPRKIHITMRYEPRKGRARGGASYGQAGPTETVGTTAYGVESDPQRIAYYRLLWDLSP